MKSTSQGPVIWRIRSDEEEHRALEHADEQQVAALVVLGDLGAPSSRTRSFSWSGWTRISPIGGVAHAGAAVVRSRAVRPRAAAACARRAATPPLDDRARAVAEVERARPPAQRQHLARRARPRRAHERPRRRPRRAAARRAAQRGRQRGRRASAIAVAARRARRRRPRRAPRPRRAAAPRCAATFASAAGCTARAPARAPSRTRVRAKRRRRSSRPRATPGRARHAVARSSARA